MKAKAERLATLHAQCFQTPRPWTAAEFQEFLNDPRVICIGDKDGFAIARVIVDEAEILTIAVPENARGTGKGRELLTELLRHATARGASNCFLEVAENNSAATPALPAHRGSSNLVGAPVIIDRLTARRSMP